VQAEEGDKTVADNDQRSRPPRKMTENRQIDLVHPEIRSLERHFVRLAVVRFRPLRCEPTASWKIANDRRRRDQQFQSPRLWQTDSTVCRKGQLEVTDGIATKVLIGSLGLS
jgi:hypothetical protein